MASSNAHFFFLIFTVLFISVSLQAQARENRFFSKTMPDNQPKEGEEQQRQQEQVDFTPLSAFRESSSPSEDNQNGHGLYSHEPNQFPPTTTNPETELIPIDFNSFKTVTNEYNSFANKDLTSGYGMSDTRFLENGKYFHDVKKDGYQNGFPYQRETAGSGYGFPYYKGVDPSGSENRYGGYGRNEDRYGGYGNENRYGSYGSTYGVNENGYYGSYYNQQEQDQFIP